MTMFTWETREAWGAVEPKFRRTDVKPRGVAIHYPGPGSFVYADHASCQRIMRAWQAFHMSRGSNDLEYGAVLCNHLRLMEARVEQDRPRIRVGSNGTAAANTTHTSVQLMRGTGDPSPTADELTALGEAVAWLRVNGDWGPDVKGHRDFVQTKCPGDYLYAHLDVVRIVADRAEAAMRADRNKPRPPLDEGIPTMMLAEHASNHGVWYLIGPHSAVHVDDDERAVLLKMGVPEAKARISTPLLHKLRYPAEAERPQ